MNAKPNTIAIAAKNGILPFRSKFLKLRYGRLLTMQRATAEINTVDAVITI